MPHTGLAVVESRWWKDGNDSVRPLFETLAGIVEGNPHAVRYDMFTEERSLAQVIEDIARNENIHSLYIGAHGDGRALYGLQQAEITRTKLRNMLRNSNGRGVIRGLYFGSCLIGTAQNAEFWLSELPKTGLDWIAGYTRAVDWVDSSAVDIVFWSKYLRERQKNKSRRRGKWTELDMVKEASCAMKELMPTVFTQLGFNLYYLDTGHALEKIW